MTTFTPANTSSPTKDEAQIRQIIAEQTRAICTKNLDQIMSFYAPDIVIFDMKPPLAHRGAAACHHLWATSLPCMPTPSGTETQDLTITVSGDLALAHWLFRFTGLEPDHPAAQMWFRITAGYQRHQQGWHSIHEHISIPIEPAAA
jgi:ketosteroid isomerase-like protein